MSQEAVVLDLGSQKVAALWGRSTPEGQLEVLGLGIQHHSGVFRFGEVTRPNEAAEVLESALRKALGKHRKKLRRLPVHVALSGRHYTARWARGTDNISKTDPVEISPENIRELIHIVMNEPELNGRLIFRFYPFLFRIDEAQKVPNPIGMLGRSLEVWGLAAYAQTIVLRNVEDLLHSVGISDRLLAFEYQPVAASLAVLNRGDRQEHLLVLDLGHAKVDYAFWMNQALRVAGSMSDGCHQALVQALARQFQISREKAGELLTRVGEITDTQTGPETITLSLGGQGITRQINRWDALQVIHRELDRMVYRLQEFMDRLDGSISGVVVVGGLAQLPGLLPYLEQKLHRPVRLGGIQGFVSPPGNGDPSLAVVAGALKLATQDLVPARRKKRSFLRKLQEVFKGF